MIDLPYRELTDAARAAHARIYALKKGQAAPFDEKPRPN